MSTCRSRSASIARLSGGGRRGWDRRGCELVYRNARPPAQPVRQPAPRIVHNTVHQTAVHLHQTVHQHIHRRYSAAGRRHTAPPVPTAAVQQAGAAAIDASRPAWTARGLLRILSTESARRTMRPFYQRVLGDLLIREREEYRGRPARALLLVETLLGRRRTLAVLDRFLRRTTERLEARALHRLLYRRSVQRREAGASVILLRRYALRELVLPGDLRRLPAARPPALPAALPQREPAARPPEQTPLAGQAVRGGLPFSEAHLQLLVRRVVDALDRQLRLESLRQGGM